MTPFRDGLPTIPELRAIIAGYRGRSRAAIRTTTRQLATVDADDRLLEILATPFSSVEDTHDRLVETETYLRERDDRRAVFLTVYAEMTAAVQQGIESGSFVDPDWAREYLITFAEYYRRALVAFERRDFEAVPDPWLLGFGASVRGETLIAQDALLGINAHINYDLTYTLEDVSLDPDREAKRTDHLRINDILQRLVDVVQETLVAVYSALGVSEIDDLLGPIDERLAVLGLERSRQFAWRNAVLLVDHSWDPVARYVDWRVRTVSTGAAQLLLSLQLDATTRRQLRTLEADQAAIAIFHEEFGKQLSPDLFDNRP
jgi:hypothetical protein